MNQTSWLTVERRSSVYVLQLQLLFNLGRDSDQLKIEKWNIIRNPIKAKS